MDGGAIDGAAIDCGKFYCGEAMTSYGKAVSIIVELSVVMSFVRFIGLVLGTWRVFTDWWSFSIIYI